MADSGQITSADLIKEDALDSFKRLQELVKKSIVTVDKLKAANLSLNKVIASGASSERAIRKVNKLRQESIADLKKINILKKEQIASEAQINIATKKSTVSQRGFTTATKGSSKAMVALRSIISTTLGPLAILFAIFKGIGKLKDTVVVLDSFRFALDKITDSSARTTETMRFLIKTSDDFGINLEVAANRYVKFFTAAKQSGLELDKTRQIFSDTSKAAGVLGLNTEEVRGVFLALEQMLSKGKVTTEELRRQLGERLPGAFGVMAQTVNELNPDIEVTVQTLDDMLKKGQVLSAEVLPEFARMYNEAFGIDKVDKVETLAAAQARFGNAWTKLVFEIENGESRISKAFQFIFDAGSLFFDALADKITLLGDEYLTFTQKLQIASIGLFGQSERELAALTRQYDLLEKTTFSYMATLKGQKIDLGNTAEATESYKNKLTILNNLVGDSNLTLETRIKLILELDEVTKKQIKGDDLLNKIGLNSITALQAQAKVLREYLESRVDDSNLNDKLTKDKVAELKLIDKQIKKLQELLGLKKGEKPFLIFDNLEFPTEAEFDEEFRKWLKDLNKTIDKIFKDEDLIDFSKLINDEPDPFEFDTFRIAANNLRKEFAKEEPLLNLVSEERANRWVDEYKGLYGEDITNYEDFLKDKVELTEDTLDALEDLNSAVFDFASTLYDNELIRIADRRAALEEYYDVANELAQDDEDLKADLRRKELADIKQLDKEERKIKREAAVLEKAQKITSTIMGTASAIAGATNPFLKALYATIGAIQLATVIAQRIPKYKDGRGKGKAEFAYVGDGGVQEVVHGSKGTYVTPDKATMTYLNPDDQVFKNKKDFGYYMNSQNTGNIKQGKDYNFSKDIQDGLSKAKIENNIETYVKVDIGHNFWLKSQSQF